MVLWCAGVAAVAAILLMLFTITEHLEKDLRDECEDCQK